jgi:hypothetical protein
MLLWFTLGAVSIVLFVAAERGLEALARRREVRRMGPLRAMGHALASRGEWPSDEEPPNGPWSNGRAL